MLTKIITTLFVLFVGSKIFNKFRDKSIGIWALLIWILVLAGILFVVFEPNVSDQVAHAFGVQRGTDIAFFLSILGLIYVAFRLYMKIDSLDKDLTKLAENTSIEIHKINKKNDGK